MGNVSITVAGLETDGAQKILDLAKKLGGGRTVATGPTENKNGKGPKGKKTKPVDDDEELLDDEESSDDEELEDDEESEDEETEDDEESEDDEDLEDEEESEDEETGPTKKAVQAAFKKFLAERKVKGKVDAKANRAEGIKILKALKVKSVDDVKEKDYKKVLVLLKKGMK